tara:strand:+ start:9378 stop:10559 length:1182 start_codon:yes stop_codon:yes gene_type:complete
LWFFGDFAMWALISILVLGVAIAFIGDDVSDPPAEPEDDTPTPDDSEGQGDLLDPDVVERPREPDEETPIEPSEPELEPAPETGQIVLTLNGNQAGTEGDDTVTLADDLEIAALQFDGAGGNDSIDLLDLSDPVDLSQSHIVGGDGDDTISALGATMTLQGGSGDDVLSGNGPGAELDGGEGNDLITATAYEWRAIDQSNLDPYPTDVLELIGGEGNDTLDARASTESSTSGGDGDDLLMTRGSWYGRAPVGSVVHDGGAGDDTLIAEVPFDYVWADATGLVSLRGGEGADTFEVRIDANSSIELNSDRLTEPRSLGAPGPRIQDFDPAEDQLIVDLSAIDNGFTVSDLTVSDYNGNSTLSVSMVNGFDTRVISMQLEGVTGLSLDDITVRTG